MSVPDKRGIWHSSWAEVNRANREYEQADALTSLAKQAEESNARARAAEQQERLSQLHQAARRQVEEERIQEQLRVESLMRTPEGRAQLAREQKTAEFTKGFLIVVCVLFLLCILADLTILIPFLLVGSGIVFLLHRFSQTEVGQIVNKAGGQFILNKLSKKLGSAEDADKKYAALVADKATRDTAYLEALWVRKEIDEFQNESIIGFEVFLNDFGQNKQAVSDAIRKVLSKKEVGAVEERLTRLPEVIAEFNDEEKALGLITAIEAVGGSSGIRVKRQTSPNSKTEEGSYVDADGKPILEKEVLEGLVILKKKDRIDFFFSGRLDTAAGLSFSSRFKEAVDSNPQTIVANMKEATYIGSKVLRLLFEAARRQKDRGGSLQITEADESLKRVFRLTGMDILLTESNDSNSLGKLKYEIKDRVLRVFLTGRWNADFAWGLRQDLYKLASKHHGDIRFDASELTDASSFLRDVCINISNSAKVSGGTFGIENASPKVKTLFRKAGLENYIVS